MKGRDRKAQERNGSGWKGNGEKERVGNVRNRKGRKSREKERREEGSEEGKERKGKLMGLKRF